MSSVIFNEHTTLDGKVVVEIILNAERSLNALSFEMIKLIQPRLVQYRDDDRVVALILDSSGEKSFCAGGDVISLFNALQKEESKAFAEQYFEDEYCLDYMIHAYPKPIIGWGSGIVMGGGLGILAGCRHRIVTPTTMMAMPEVTIGLYPDVGASWFLNRCPGRTGLFVGITGQRMNAADALYMGLADRYLDTRQRSVLLERLLQLNWQGDHEAELLNVLQQLEAEADVVKAASEIEARYTQIQALTDVVSPQALFNNMQSLQTDDPWLLKAKDFLMNGSPLSIHLIYEQLQRSQHWSLKECFLSELALSIQCCRQGDVSEGIRALLIDKDKSPQWRFSSVDAVDNDSSKEMFSLPWSVNPLAKHF